MRCSKVGATMTIVRNTANAELTFIILALPRDVPLGVDSPLLVSVCPMVGDVNVFLSHRYNDDNAAPCLYAEMEVMVAERDWRRRGLAREALQMLLHYITHEAHAPFPLDPVRLFARISMDNTASQALFEQLGFQTVSESAVFQEVEMAVVDPACLAIKAPVAVLSWP